jgi:hypothetical protein
MENVNINNFDKKNKINEINYKYKCEECGIDFGKSIGDMELHKLIIHLQSGNININDYTNN